MTYPDIHIWGDSLARGIVYDERRGRYAISGERCAAHLEKALGRKVINHSIMGATVEDGLCRFTAAPPSQGAVCAIEFGGNDCDLNWAAVAKDPASPIAAKVPIPRFVQLMTDFVTLSRQRDMEPVLITPPPLHAPRYFDWVTRGLDRDNVLCALGDVEHIYRWQERYTIAVRRVAAATACRLLDVRDAFLATSHYENYLCVDGIHPNDAGHRLISQAVLGMTGA